MTGGFIARLWRGEHDLHDTFWRYVILYGLIVNVATSVGFMALISLDRPAAAAFVGYALSVPYNVFVLVALFRAAGAYKGMPSTPAFMRIASVLWMVLLTIT